MHLYIKVFLLTGSLYFKQIDCISVNIGNTNHRYILTEQTDTLALLNKYISLNTDSLSLDYHYEVLNTVRGLSLNSNSKEVKAIAIEYFVKQAKSKDSGIGVQAAKNLKSYHRQLFSPACIDSIHHILGYYPIVYKDMVELVGFIGHAASIEVIKSIFPSSRTFTKPEIWSTYKALARLGDTDALSYCLEKVQTLPMNDHTIENLYPDLVYIHRRESFDVLIKALNSDDKRCTSANPNSDQSIPCAYRIMEMLAPAIADFPIKVLPSGDLDTRSYPRALKKARRWLKEKGDTYIIIDSY